MSRLGLEVIMLESSSCILQSWQRQKSVGVVVQLGILINVDAIDEQHVLERVRHNDVSKRHLHKLMTY
jgi:hypothetical protein